MISGQANPKKQKLTLLMATTLVAGTMIGSGIFLLPASLALYGGISLLGWLFTSVGALLLALALSRLSRMIPKAGGPYAYTLEGFGQLPGFLVGWGYWLALMAGVAAVAVAAVGYLGVFFPELPQLPLLSGLVACLLIWAMVGVNVVSVRQAGVLQVITTALKILPILLVIILGFAFWNFDQLTPFNISGKSNFEAITATATLTLWAFLGIESAAVAAENVEEPQTNVAKATTYGMLIAAVIYILGSTAVITLVPIEELQKSTAPFADAAKRILGTGAEYLVAIGAVISCLGALNGMTMLVGQMPYALARDQLFAPGFKVTSPQGTPRRGLVLSGFLVTIFIGLNYTKSLVDLFTFIILLSTLSILLPYSFAAMSELAILLKRRNEFSREHLRKSTVLALLAFLYALWVITGAGRDIVFYGFILFLSGIPFFILFKWLNIPDENHTKPTSNSPVNPASEEV